MSVDALTAPMATTDPGDGGAAEAPRRLERGMQFGRFLVTALLGSGGAGAVYAAYDPELDRRVALKVLHVADDVDEDADPLRAEWPRLVREARALAKLSHPNVVVIHDIGIERGRAWLATELVDGSDLFQWLAVRRGLALVDILAPFVQAGRGLAAAHAAGLVHGDFKPANVLVGKDGRARVADFGLARMQVRTSVPSGATAREDGIVIAGTPYYMAPEQLIGAEADARADQYSFCLALLEAVAGRRVYASLSAATLFMAKQEPIADAMFEGVPTWLAKIAARGLSRDPADRHASMDALLAAIAAAQVARSRRRVGLGIASALALGAGVTYVGVGSKDAACTGSTRHLEGVWDDARKQAVSNAFAAAQPALGPAAFSRAATALDAFTTAWIDGHQNACLVVHHREQRIELVDARGRCLDDRLGRLAALVDLLAEADTDTVLRADAAIAALPEVAACADADLVVRQFGAQAEDPAQTEALAQHLRRIDAALFVARHDRAQASIDEAAAMVTTDRGRHAIAVRRGNLLHQRGLFAEAERELEAAILGAVAVGDDATGLLGIGPMIRSVGAAQLRWDDASAWARWREPLVARSDASPRTRADLLAAAAAIDSGLHDFDRALQRLEEARALLVDAEVPAVEIALLDVDIGGVLVSRHDLEGAETRITGAREIIGRELGTDHPEYAVALGELGIVRAFRGDQKGARALLEDSLAVWRAAYGADHPAIAPALNNLAALDAEAGDYASARELLLESLVVERKRYGDDSLATAPTLVNLATAALWMDQPRIAIDELAQAERIFRAVDPERPELAGVYRQKSYAEAALGRAAEAVEDGLRAVEMFDRHRGADDPARADARTQLGSARLLAGDRQGAKVAYDEAIVILERNAERAPAIAAMLADALEGRAEVHAAVGDAASATADRERARAIAIPRGQPTRVQ